MQKSNKPCNLFFAPFGHTVIPVFIQIILYAGGIGERDDVRFVGWVAKGPHENQLLRLFDAGFFKVSIARMCTGRKRVRRCFG